jgi:eukaryotic-like serine/threonine-protein kinase
VNASVPNDLTIFNAALDIAGESDRAAYLDQACGSDAALRKKVESLLAAYASESGILEDLEKDPLGARREGGDEEPGTVIGRYKLQEKIGEGGFGEVWMAEQREPVKRRVALKIIKPGMDSRQIVARSRPSVRRLR